MRNTLRRQKKVPNARKITLPPHWFLDGLMMFRFGEDGRPLFTANGPHVLAALVPYFCIAKPFCLINVFHHKVVGVRGLA